MREVGGIRLDAEVAESKDVRERAAHMGDEGLTSVKEGLQEADTLVQRRLETSFLISESETEAFPNEARCASDWEKLGRHPESSNELTAVNPHFAEGNQWRVNCQRCVPTFEMRMRGYDVVAKPNLGKGGLSDLCHQPFDVWENPEVTACEGSGRDDIERSMERWGDGSRAQVVVIWRGTNAGHTFVAEQVGGKTRFYDPQTGNADASAYFNRVEEGRTRFCRMDNVDVTNRIKECCERA